MFRLFAAVCAGILLASCAVVTPLPEPTDTQQRLAMFPKDNLPLTGKVTVRWNDHQIPYLEAENDSDAAYTLGLIHAHLRLGQMEIMRRVSQGRIAEMAGPIAAPVDVSLQTLGFGRAVDQILADMPAETREYLERFTQGINDYVARAQALPHEFSVLDLKVEPWTPRDVLTIGRLSGTDVNWLVFATLLPQVHRPDWPAIWARVTGQGAKSPTSFAGRPPENAVALIKSLESVQIFNKSGSNSVVVSPKRSATGSALIANDPHLGVSLPNLWLLAGLKTPTAQVVGAMIPGVPVFAFGRTPYLAWGGTNLLAAGTDLVDISQNTEKIGKVSDAERSASETKIAKVRYWRDRKFTVRLSGFGPVISGIPFWPENAPKDIALKWVGHIPSDEMTSLLSAVKAKSPAEFRKAFSTFAIPAQNILFADINGNIGQFTATFLPNRRGIPADMVRQPDDVQRDWKKMLNVNDLPSTMNPEQGWIASANNRPAASDGPIGYVFAPPARMLRMQELLGNDQKISLADLKALQRDVYDPSDMALAQNFLSMFNNLNNNEQQQVLRGLRHDPIRVLSKWDGFYHADSRGALAFQAMLGGAMPALYDLLHRQADFAWIKNSQSRIGLFAEDLQTLPKDQHTALLRRAVVHANDIMEEYGTWGEIHILRLQHPLGNLPGIGIRYRFADWPGEGGLNTLNKRAHGPLFDAAVQTVKYGAQARHISDLGDPDANWFVLLGGQDGWFNSADFLDQAALWQKGEYIQMPLSEPQRKQQFPVVMPLQAR